MTAAVPELVSLRSAPLPPRGSRSPQHPPALSTAPDAATHVRSLCLGLAAPSLSAAPAPAASRPLAVLSVRSLRWALRLPFSRIS